MITDFYPIQKNLLSNIYEEMKRKVLSKIESGNATQSSLCKYIAGTLKRNKFNVPKNKSDLLSLTGAKSIRELCIHGFYNICRCTENGTFLVWIVAYGVHKENADMAFIVKVTLNTKEHVMTMPFP